MDAAERGPRATIDVCVVTHNSVALVPELVATLERLEPSPGQVTVVDSGSTDGTADACRQRGLNVIDLGANRGFGAACNLGVERSDADVVVLLNPDVSLPDDLLGALAPTFGDPRVAAVGVETGSPPRDATLRPSATVSGSCLAVRRADYLAVGGMDEGLFLYWEDTDLCWRFWLAGHRVLRDHRILVDHVRGGTGGGRRWRPLQIENGIVVATRTLPWVAASRVVARLALQTLVEAIADRRIDLIRAWPRALRNSSRRILEPRRRLASARRAHGRDLTRLVREHDRDQWRRRLERLRNDR